MSKHVKSNDNRPGMVTQPPGPQSSRLSRDKAPTHHALTTKRQYPLSEKHRDRPTVREHQLDREEHLTGYLSMGKKWEALNLVGFLRTVAS